MGFRGDVVNGFPFLGNMGKEIVGWSNLKKAGYSCIRIIGKDGTIRNYLKKVRTKDIIYIGNKPRRGYLINEAKRLTCDGMPEYWFFITNPVGISLEGSTELTAIDSKNLTELIDYASIVGEKSADRAKGGNMMWILLGLGGGVMLSMLLKGFGLG